MKAEEIRDPKVSWPWQGAFSDEIDDVALETCAQLAELNERMERIAVALEKLENGYAHVHGGGA